MKFTKYTIKTTTKDADMVSALLMDVDINDVQIENNVQLTDEELNQMYADFKKELPEDDGNCDVSFFIEFNEDENEQLKISQMLEELKVILEEAPSLYGIDPVTLEKQELDSVDWENNWKEYFKPFRVDNILITPTWEEIPGDIDALENKGGKESKEKGINTIIKIDPGMAFGTGTHETTRLCLRGLREYIKPGYKVLDLGCGSGILGIGSIKMNAGEITSVDIDEQAVKVAKENFEINQIPSDVSNFYVGDVVKDEELKETVIGRGPFDIVVVNILADVINIMMPTLDKYLRKDGILITSGILDVKEQLIRDAIANNENLELVDVFADGEWVRITAKKVK